MCQDLFQSVYDSSFTWVLTFYVWKKSTSDKSQRLWKYLWKFSITSTPRWTWSGPHIMEQDWLFPHHDSGTIGCDSFQSGLDFLTTCFDLFELHQHLVQHGQDNNKKSGSGKNSNLHQHLVEHGQNLISYTFSNECTRCTRMYTYVYNYTHICTCVCVCWHTRTYVYTYIYTHLTFSNIYMLFSYIILYN